MSLAGGGFSALDLSGTISRRILRRAMPGYHVIGKITCYNCKDVKIINNDQIESDNEESAKSTFKGKHKLCKKCLQVGTRSARSTPLSRLNGFPVSEGNNDPANDATLGNFFRSRRSATKRSHVDSVAGGGTEVGEPGGDDEISFVDAGPRRRIQAYTRLGPPLRNQLVARFTVL